MTARPDVERLAALLRQWCAECDDTLYEGDAAWAAALGSWLAARGVTLAAAPPTGPWHAVHLAAGPDTWFVQMRPGKYDACHGPFTESEATAVRDALNRLAAERAAEEGRL